ncbi:MAG: tetratricopeptide repeat protein [Saprospiraceae bacterium]|nr:tetratricopeptide repeat protein [Saprospiraceae bacterium]
MNLRKGIFSLLLCCLFASMAVAQQTTVYTEATASYKRGVDLFDQGVYGLAQLEFQNAINLLRPVNEPEWRPLKTDAELYYAKCAVRLDQPEAEKLTLDILRNHAPSPVASQAALEIGNYYFNAKEYDKALTYYDMAPESAGPAADEMRFKRGYAYFVTKKFSQAKYEFSSLKENSRSEWYYPSNYYYGCCAFFEKKYDEALKAFQKCEGSDKYKSYIPYYVTQIYAAKKQYDQVISYAEPKAKTDGIRNRPEMNQLVGQAYFERGDYASALPFLEYAAQNGAPLRASDYYQLGYAQYQTAHYKSAIENFEQLNKQDSLLGQNGLYHLGDCYLKTGNKFAARNAFGQAANLNFDKSVKEDALFNYAKLSYELKYDRDALDALQRIQPGSRYYEDAQLLMSDIFLNTRDYDRAISTLESIKNRPAKLNETYQQVCYLRGLQLYQNGQRNEARQYFNRSLDNPIDKRTSTLCSYWLGTISNEEGEYAISKQHMASFIGNAKNYNDLPDESSLWMGHYVQGYNHLKLKDYNLAQANFKASVDGIKKNYNRIQSEQVKSGVLGDAVLRLGDCYFKKNQYGEALTHYNEAVNKKYEGFEYALYQKAIIRGLQGSPLDKIIDLETLVSKYPNGRYTDEALFQIGDTYQEMGKLTEAIPPLRRLVSDFRGKSNLVNQALLKLGLISYNQGNTQAAINYYKQVFANNPENDEAKDALAALEEIYVKDLNRPDEYFAFLETVPGYKVDNSEKEQKTFQAAEAQFQNGRYPQAIEGFSNYLSRYPNGPNATAAYFYRAESYASDPVKKYSQAITDYASVVNKGPGKYFSKSAEKATLLAYYVENDYPRALELGRKWEEGAVTDASRTEAQVIVMRAAYATKNTATVNEYATKVSSSNSASAEQLATANFYLGKMAYDRSDYTRAMPSLLKVTQTSQSEQSAEAWHLIAQIQFKQKQYAQAEETIGNANQASAGYDDWIARNLILLSDVYYEQGDKNSAAAALEVVIENYSGEDESIKSTARQKYDRLGGNTPRPQVDGSKGVDLIDPDGN